MNVKVLDCLTWVIAAFPLGASIVRRKHIHRSFYPFIMITWIGLLCEVLPAVIHAWRKVGALSGNIYGLVEPIFWFWLFHNWGRLPYKWINGYSLWLFLFVIWIIDNVLLHSITTTNTIHMVVYSFCMVFLAMEQLNYQIVTVRHELLKDSSFIICLGLLIFFASRAFLEVFYMLHLRMSWDFYGNLMLIMFAINLFCNLIFGVAILWIKKKQKFTLPY
jgi:hypothetical protein